MPRVPIDRRLTEFEEPDGVLFRIRIVQPPGPEHHKLLGEADGVSFVKAGEAEDHRRHLLTPVPEALDQELWRLDFESDPPRLLINRDAKPNWKDVARSTAFIALVYPEALRQLLFRATAADPSEDDGAEGWEADWVRFARQVGGLGPPPGPEEDVQAEREKWVSEAVAAFARKNELRKKWDTDHGEDQ